MPGQEWAATTPDTRTFGNQVERLLDDLNKPDLASIAQSYLQDAVRYFQRKPLFNNETDNSVVFGWGQTALASTVQGSLFYTQGATIFATASDGKRYAFVNLIAGTAGVSAPTFTPTLFAVPSGITSPPVFVPGPGTTVDGGCLWATVAPWPGQQVIYTQLCSVPYQNQYEPPLGYVQPRRIEVTWSSNLRIGMTKLGYHALRDMDVIRPTPPSSYPTYWGWFQGRLYFWPYPVGFYPITLSYLNAVPVPLLVTDSNTWTTFAEALIRHYAAYRICKVVLHDDIAAAEFQMLAAEELAGLTSEHIRRHQSDEGGGIAPDVF
jgi:hypothetical protein